MANFVTDLTPQQYAANICSEIDNRRLENEGVAITTQAIYQSIVDAITQSMAAALEDKRISGLMLIRACDDVEKCFTAQEWQVAHDEVWDGGNQGWGSVARHAILNLRNQPAFAAGRDAVIDYLQAEDFHIADSDYDAMKVLKP